RADPHGADRAADYLCAAALLGRRLGGHPRRAWPSPYADPACQYGDALPVGDDRIGPDRLRRRLVYGALRPAGPQGLEGALLPAARHARLRRELRLEIARPLVPGHAGRDPDPDHGELPAHLPPRGG